MKTKYRLLPIHFDGEKYLFVQFFRVRTTTMLVNAPASWWQKLTGELPGLIPKDFEVQEWAFIPANEFCSIVNKEYLPTSIDSTNYKNYLNFPGNIDADKIQDHLARNLLPIDLYLSDLLKKKLKIQEATFNV